MDYNEREAQRRQEDRDLNRALIWVGAAVVLEFLLSLINKYYINFRTTPESINLALAISCGPQRPAVGQPGGFGCLCGVGGSAAEAGGRAGFN